MQPTFLVSAAILASCAAAAPASQVASTCPQSYPAEVTNTPEQAVMLTIRSNNPLTNGHNVQLRHVSGEESERVVVVDESSPVLLVQVSSSFLFSQYRDQNNQIQTDGLSGSYRNVTESRNGDVSEALQEFYFDSFPANSPPPKTWKLEGGGLKPEYYLYHDVPNEVVNGFTLCKKDGFYQAYYTLSNAPNPTEYPDCEPVGLTTTYAAELSN